MIGYNTQNMTLYDHLGGGRLGWLVDHFYKQVLADPELITHFEGFDIMKVANKQRAFLKKVRVSSNPGSRRAGNL